MPVVNATDGVLNITSNSTVAFHSGGAFDMNISSGVTAITFQFPDAVGTIPLADGTTISVRQIDSSHQVGNGTSDGITLPSNVSVAGLGITPPPGVVCLQGSRFAWSYRAADHKWYAA